MGIGFEPMPEHRFGYRVSRMEYEGTRTGIPPIAGAAVVFA